MPSDHRCKHCHIKWANRPGMLCYKCYHTPGLREQYPAGKRPYQDHTRNLPLPTEPTMLPPGPSRLAVLEERAASGQALWHPDDYEADE